MANKKEIQYKAVMDMSDFDTGIQKVQQRLKQLSATEQRIVSTGTGSTGELTPQAQRQREIFTEKQRQYAKLKIDDLERSRKKDMEHWKAEENHLKEIEKMKKETNDPNKLKRLNDMEMEALEKQFDLHDKITKKLEQQQELKEKIIEEEKKDEKKDTSSDIDKIIDKVTKKITPQNMLKIAAGAATALQMYSGYLDIQKTRERELLASQAQTTQGLNLSFQNVMQNRGFMNAFEQPERQAAMEMALQEREMRLKRDPLAAVGTALGKGAGSAFAAALATGGNPYATIGAGIVGAGSEILNKNTFRMMFDREAYEADVNAEMAQRFQQNLASQRVLNFEKFAGSEQFQKRFPTMQEYQRRLQLSDEELLGKRVETFRESPEFGLMGEKPERLVKYVRKGRGQEKQFAESEEDFQARQEEYNQRMMQRRSQFEQRTKDQGMGFMQSQLYDRYGAESFTEERIRANMQQMFATGAGSEFIRGGGARMAAEYQRAGFMNAAPELGMLAGFGGSQEKTEQQYLRLLSEAVKIGFDKSKPSEDMRRFMSTITQLYTETAGAEGAVRVFGQGMVGTSYQDIKAAQEMFQRVNQESGQSTGYRGALKQQYLMSKKGREAFAGVDEDIKQVFTEMDIMSLDVNNPFIQEAAKQRGISPEEMLQEVRNMQRYGENLSGRTDKKRKRLEEAFKKFKGNSKESEADLKKEFFQSGTVEMDGKEVTGKSLMVEYLAAYARERTGVGSLKADQLEALAGFAIAGDMKGLQEAMDKLGLEGKGTVTDKGEASTAKDQLEQLKNVNRTLGELKTSFDTNLQQSYEELIQIKNFTGIMAEYSQMRTDYGEQAASEYLTQALKDLAQGKGSSDYSDQPSTSKPKEE